MKERRRDRSTVRVEAIRKQLEAIATEGDIEYIALADEFGFVIGEAGGGQFMNPADVERFGHRSAGPFRGMKSDAWEGGHRMPFLVRWPAVVPAGTVSDRTLCFTDVLATVADLLDAPLAAHEAPDSHSFLPVLRDPEAETTRTTTVLKANASVIREGDWKLITHLGSGGFSSPRRVDPGPDGPRGQLYDLAADPGETRNLWGERPDVVERLTALLAPYLEPDPRRVEAP